MQIDHFSVEQFHSPRQYIFVEKNFDLMHNFIHAEWTNRNGKKKREEKYSERNHHTLSQTTANSFAVPNFPISQHSLVNIPLESGVERTLPSN